MVLERTWIRWGLANFAMVLFGLAIATAGLADPGSGKADQQTWLGISMAAAPEGKGVLVVEVVEGSPADQASLRVNDVIVRIDEEGIVSMDELVRVIQGHDPGEMIHLTVFRDNRELTLPVTLGERPEHVLQFRVPAPEFFGWRAQGRLGVRTQGLTGQLAEYFKVPDGEGVLVSEVMEDSPAEKAGIKAGDVILEVNKERVGTARDIQRALDRTEPCQQVPVTFLRRGERATVPVTLVWSSWRARVRLGIQMQELSGQLAEHFKVPDGEGVLISEVMEDSPAEKAGLKAGDVVIEVDGERVSSTEEIHEVLGRRAPCDQVPVVILRDGQRRSVAVRFTGGPGAWFRVHIAPLPRGFMMPEGWLREEELNERIREALRAARPELQRTVEELKREIERLKEELDRLKREGA